MAEQRGAWDRDQLSCSICLHLLNEPVTLSCGHSYCRGCIEDCWDLDDQRGVYACPLCRQTFHPRPVLKTSTLLKGLVENIKTTALQAASPTKCYAGPKDVACDVCTGRKQKALKSCLVCLASYCETHLQTHYLSPAFKKHKLIKAFEILEEKICPQHDKVLECFCRTDQKCICYLCSMDEHKGHDTVSAAAERTEKQRYLANIRQKSTKTIKKREKEIQEARKAVKSVKRSAQAALDHCEKTFTEMIRSIERRRSEVRELIRAQRKALVSPAEEVLKELEREVAELRRRDDELKQISQTDDHIHFLKHYQSFTSPGVCSDLPSVGICPPSNFEAVREHMSNMKQKLEDMLEVECCKISTNANAEEVQPLVNARERTFADQNRPKSKTYILSVKAMDIVLPPEPKSRTDFLQYYRRLMVNPNTPHRELCLSNQNRRVTWTEARPYPYHPERFTDRWQVLCEEGLTGRCYWEVEWNGWFDSAVSYKDIKRTGKTHDYAFGYNEKSWSLECSVGSYNFRHNGIETEIRDPQSSRLGMYLDHSAGTLSFYSVSDSMSLTLLHRVQTTFTQPLYAGFVVSMMSSAELCDL